MLGLVQQLLCRRFSEPYCGIYLDIGDNPGTRGNEYSPYIDITDIFGRGEDELASKFAPFLPQFSTFFR